MHQQTRAPQRTAIHRLSLRTAGAVAITLATLSGAQAATSTNDTIKAYKLCTGADNASHVLQGSIDQKYTLHLRRNDDYTASLTHLRPDSDTGCTVAFATQSRRRGQASITA